LACLRFVDLLDLRFLEATPDSVAAQYGTSDRLPSSLTGTLSALANLPGGGLVIWALTSAGFRPVPLADPQALKQGLAAQGRTLPPGRTVTANYLCRASAWMGQGRAGQG
jgi:hypothetical protein